MPRRLRRESDKYSRMLSPVQRAAAVAFLFAASVAASGTDWADIARSSDRSIDATLVEVIAASDLGTAEAVCAAVGRRPDPFAGSIITALWRTHYGRTRDRAEYLLRVLLAGLLDPGFAEPPLADRLAGNRAALEEIGAAVSEITDPQLIGLLLRTSAAAAAPFLLPRALMDVSRRLSAELVVGAGRLSAPETSLARDFLGAAAALGSADFVEPCAAIAGLSRDADLVGRARQTARILAGPALRP
jgi:hypothetical protein